MRTQAYAMRFDAYAIYDVGPNFSYDHSPWTPHFALNVSDVRSFWETRVEPVYRRTAAPRRRRLFWETQMETRVEPVYRRTTAPRRLFQDRAATPFPGDASGPVS